MFCVVLEEVTSDSLLLSVPLVSVLEEFPQMLDVILDTKSPNPESVRVEFAHTSLASVPNPESVLLE